MFNLNSFQKVCPILICKLSLCNIFSGIDIKDIVSIIDIKTKHFHRTRFKKRFYIVSHIIIRISQREGKNSIHIILKHNAILTIKQLIERDLIGRFTHFNRLKRNAKTRMRISRTFIHCESHNLNLRFRKIFVAFKT